MLQAQYTTSGFYFSLYNEYACEFAENASEITWVSFKEIISFTAVFRKFFFTRDTPQNVASRKGGTKLYMAINMYLHFNTCPIKMQVYEKKHYTCWIKLSTMKDKNYLFFFL
jgi:hypothetical protein